MFKHRFGSGGVDRWAGGWWRNRNEEAGCDNVAKVNKRDVGAANHSNAKPEAKVVAT